MSGKHLSLVVILALGIFLSACSDKATPAARFAGTSSPEPVVTPAYDPCASENLAAEVKKTHDLTREFDDYSTLTSNLPQAQIAQFIPSMQAVKRRAEDQQVPVCLQTLKELQVSHMTVVLDTLLTFVGVTDQAGADRVSAGILRSRETRVKYDVERARILGVTLAPATNSQSPTPSSTGTAPSP